MYLKNLSELNLDGKFRESVEENLPAPSKDEYQKMRADIKENGIQVPILVTKDNLVVDGYHRAKVAKELGIKRVPCEVIDSEDLSEEQLIDRAILLNIARRQLSPEQKQVIIRRLREKGLTQKEIEEKTGIPDSTVSDVEKKIKKRGTNSEVGISSAPDLRLKIPKSEYENIAKRAKNGETQGQIAADYKTTTRNIRKILKKHKKQEEIEQQKQERSKKELPNPNTYKIVKADAFNFLPTLEDKSFDLLFTDPPYMTEFEDNGFYKFVYGWLDLALRKIKPTGRAYIFTGSYPDELFCYLMGIKKVLHDLPGWKLSNILVWTYKNTIGPTPTHEYKSNWQACFYLYGPDAPPLNSPSMLEQFSVHEVNAPDARQSTRYHTWEKPEDLAKRFISHSTKKGERILDPFCGTGTFVLAGARMGREVVACEISNEMLETCKKRGLRTNYGNEEKGVRIKT